MQLRTKALLLAGGGLLVALLVLWCLSIPTEPSYNGRTLSEWMALRLKSYSTRDADALTRSNEIVQAIRAIGTNGIPLALEWLKYDPKTALGPKLEKALSHLPFRSSPPPQPLFSPLRLGERQSAYGYQLFMCLGSNAAPAIPALVKIAYATNAEFPSQRALMCLGVIGSNAFPALNRIFADTNYSMRRSVIQSMAWGNASRAADWSIALPLIVKSLDDPDTNVCFMSYVALGWFRDKPETCLPLLTDALMSTNQFKQLAATYGLRGLGEQATSAVPALVPLLTNSEIRLRFAATNALMRIDSNSIYLEP